MTPCVDPLLHRCHLAPTPAYSAQVALRPKECFEMYKALLRTVRVNVRFSGIATPRRLLMLFLLASLLLAVPSSLRSLTAAEPHAAADASAVLVDPDKAPSELNHHIAGLMLIVIGVMVICGHRFKELAFLRQLWPLL